MIVQVGDGTQLELFKRVSEILNRKVDIGKGICHELCVEWLIWLVVGKKEIEDLYNFNQIKFDPSFGKNTDEDAAKGSATYFMGIAQRYNSYVHDWYASQDNEGELNVTLGWNADKTQMSPEKVEKVYVQLSSGSSMEVVNAHDANDWTDLIRHIIGSGRGIPRYFLLNLMWTNDGHTVAVAWVDEERIVLYDPNRGVYEMGTIDDVMEYCNHLLIDGRVATSFGFREVAYVKEESKEADK